MPSRCPNSRLIAANIVSRSVRLLTSARTARLPAPSVSFAACSDPSFNPQMATRAPSLSNSCAAASPIPLLQPVIRIFLSADDANALNDTFSDCPHIGFTFLNSDGTFWNCDTRLLRRRWLIFQEAHLGAHFRLNDLQIRPSDLDLDFDRALLAVGCGVNLHQSR